MGGVRLAIGTVSRLKRAPRAEDICASFFLDHGPKTKSPGSQHDPGLQSSNGWGKCRLVASWNPLRGWGRSHPEFPWHSHGCRSGWEQAGRS